MTLVPICRVVYALGDKNTIESVQRRGMQWEYAYPLRL